MEVMVTSTGEVPPIAVFTAAAIESRNSVSVAGTASASTDTDVSVNAAGTICVPAAGEEEGEIAGI